MVVSKKLELYGNLLSGPVPGGLASMVREDRWTCSFVPSGSALTCPLPADCASGTCINGCDVGSCPGASTTVEGSAQVVMEFDVNCTTFGQQRSTYLANTADYLGVGLNRLRFEAEETCADPASSPTRVTLVILPVPDGASGTEPSAEEVAARLVDSDKEELSDRVGAGIISAAALEEGEKDTDDFPLLILAGLIVLVGLAAVVCAAVGIYRCKPAKAARDTQWPPAWASSGSLSKNTASRSCFNSINRSSDTPSGAHKVDLPTLEAGDGATRKISGCRSGPPATEGPLPDGWETLYAAPPPPPHTTPTPTPYTTTDDTPADLVTRRHLRCQHLYLPTHPQRYDEEGDPYYHNEVTGDVAWVRPT